MESGLKFNDYGLASYLKNEKKLGPGEIADKLDELRNNYQQT